MDKSTQEFHQIQATKSVAVDYDIADGWFAIVDSEEYDTPGAVALGIDELDALIVALGALRERVMVAKRDTSAIRSDIEAGWQEVNRLIKKE